MFAHRWLARAWPLGPRACGRALALILTCLLGGVLSAHADSRKATEPPEDVDTEDLFGFTEGGSTGTAGERELENSVTGHFGKADGWYGTTANTSELKYSLTDDFRLSVAPTVAYDDMTGVSDVPDRRQAVLQEISFNARLRLLDPSRAPFGLTVSVEPHWGFADDISGAPVEQRGAEFLAIVDLAVVPEWLFGAVNLSYEPDRTRFIATGEVDQDSTLGVAAALAFQTMPGVFIGGEARYLSRYEGVALDAFAGEAFYVGPTLAIRLSHNVLVGAAWNFQVWGSSAAAGGMLDLTDFERHQAKLRLVIDF